MKYAKITIVLAGVLILALSGCERKVVNEVVDTGSVGVVDCFECHNGVNELGAEVILASRQWENSQHATGENMRSSGSCAGCHTNEGFIARITGEEVSSDVFTSVGCFTCHDPHTNANFKLRTASAVELGNGAIYNRGASNLCAQCHKGRRNVETYVYDGVELSNHFGPHHSNQSDMLLGENAYEYDGYDYDVDSWHTTGVAEGCVKCHFRVSDGYVVGGHTFWMEADEQENTDACNVTGCHATYTEIDEFDRVTPYDFDDDGDDTEGVQTEIDDLMEELETLLIGAGLLEWVDEAGAWEPTDGLEVADADDAGAVFNWSFVHEDKSHGIHNTRYAVALLKSSINYMETGDPEGRPSQQGDMLTAH